MTQPRLDPAGFRAFEAAGWAARANAYHRVFGPISAHLVGPLLDVARVGPGTRVLDLATGPGYGAALAATRGASVVGVDASADMVRLAARLHPGIPFCQADVEQLPFADGTADAVVGNLLLPHLAEPERGVAEATRVLAPGGTLALTVWDIPARSRLMGVLLDAVQAAGASAPADLPAGPPVFRFSDEAAFRALLKGAGLVDVSVQTVAFTHHLPDAGAYWDGMVQATVRTAAMVVRQPAAVQARIRAEVDRLLAGYSTAEGIALPIVVKMAVGLLALPAQAGSRGRAPQ